MTKGRSQDAAGRCKLDYKQPTRLPVFGMHSYVLFNRSRRGPHVAARPTLIAIAALGSVPQELPSPFLSALGSNPCSGIIWGAIRTNFSHCSTSVGSRVRFPLRTSASIITDRSTSRAKEFRNFVPTSGVQTDRNSSRTLELSTGSREMAKRSPRSMSLPLRSLSAQTASGAATLISAFVAPVAVTSLRILASFRIQASETPTPVSRALKLPTKRSTRARSRWKRK